MKRVAERRQDILAAIAWHRSKGHLISARYFEDLLRRLDAGESTAPEPLLLPTQDDLPPGRSS